MLCRLFRLAISTFLLCLGHHLPLHSGRTHAFQLTGAKYLRRGLKSKAGSFGTGKRRLSLRANLCLDGYESQALCPDLLQWVEVLQVARRMEQLAPRHTLGQAEMGPHTFKDGSLGGSFSQFEQLNIQKNNKNKTKNTFFEGLHGLVQSAHASFRLHSGEGIQIVGKLAHTGWIRAGPSRQQCVLPSPLS